MLEAPGSARVDFVSPTAFERMRTCRLRESFSRAATGGIAVRTAPQAFGDILHAIFERLVQRSAEGVRELSDEFDSIWQETAPPFVDSVHRGPHEPAIAGPLRSWPGFALKVARMKRAVTRLEGLLHEAPSPAQFLLETPLAAREGRLRGRPDLIIRGEAETWLLDYKTGAVLDDEGSYAKPAYQRQLLLYAVLEHEATGRWPTRACLVPINGSPVDVRVDPSAATDLADEAMDLLDRYNETVPAAQPGNPSPDVCRFCAHAARCPSFWNAYDESWPEQGLIAVAGKVARITTSALGVAAVVVDSTDGDANPRPVGIQHVALSDHPALAEAGPGDYVHVVGLRLTGSDKAYALAPGATSARLHDA